MAQATAPSYTERYRSLMTERAHARRAARLRSLLAPYLGHQVTIPQQRTGR